MKVVKKIWVIVDKKRRVIGSGVPRNRELKFIESTDGTQRILSYGSKKKAEAGFKVSGFYSWGEVGKYLLEEYEYGKSWQEPDGTWKRSGVKFEDFLEAVEAQFSIEI